MSYLDILILVVLEDGPKHGYEIRQVVEGAVAGTVSLNPNVLYPALHRFEEMGALQMTVEAQARRPARHVYRLTERGREVLLDLLRDFGPGEATSEAEFHTRVAFFHLLAPEERLEILERRSAALAAERAQLDEFAHGDAPSEWSFEVVHHSIEEVELAQAWVESLRQRVRAGRGPRRKAARR